MIGNKIMTTSKDHNSDNYQSTFITDVPGRSQDICKIEAHANGREWKLGRRGIFEKLMLKSRLLHGYTLVYM